MKSLPVFVFILLYYSSNGFIALFRQPLRFSSTQWTNRNVNTLLILSGSKKWKNIDLSNLNELSKGLKNVKNELGIEDLDTEYDDGMYYEDSIEYDNNSEYDSNSEYDAKSGTRKEISLDGNQDNNDKNDLLDKEKGKKEDDYDSEYEYYDEYEYYHEEEEEKIDEKLMKIHTDIDERRDVVDMGGDIEQATKQKYYNPKPSPRQFDYLNIGIGDDFTSPLDYNHMNEEEKDYDEHEEDEDDGSFLDGKELCERSILDEVDIHEDASEETTSQIINDDVSNLLDESPSFSGISNNHMNYPGISEEPIGLVADLIAVEEGMQNNQEKMAKHQEAKVKNVWRKLQQWGSPKRSNRGDNPMNIFGINDQDDEPGDNLPLKPKKNAEYYFQGGKEVSIGNDELGGFEENLSEFGEFGEWKITPQEARSISLDADTPPPAAFTVKQLMKAAENKYRRHETDVGSSEVQIARIHERIVHLAKHLESHHKDNACQYGLIKLVNRRRKLLNHLYKSDEELVYKIVKEYGIRFKPPDRVIPRKEKYWMFDKQNPRNMKKRTNRFK